MTISFNLYVQPRVLISNGEYVHSQIKKGVNKKYVITYSSEYSNTQTNAQLYYSNTYSLIIIPSRKGNTKSLGSTVLTGAFLKVKPVSKGQYKMYRRYQGCIILNRGCLRYGEQLTRVTNWEQDTTPRHE